MSFHLHLSRARPGPTCPPCPTIHPGPCVLTPPRRHFSGLTATALTQTVSSPRPQCPPHLPVSPTAGALAEQPFRTHTLSAILFMIPQQLPAVDKTGSQLPSTEIDWALPACALAIPSWGQPASRRLGPCSASAWKNLLAPDHLADSYSHFMTELRDFFFLGKALPYLPFQKLCICFFHRNNYTLGNSLYISLLNYSKSFLGTEILSYIQSWVKRKLDAHRFLLLESLCPA